MKESKYFVNCPGCGFEEFETKEARDKAAQECIEHHLDEFWDEDVTGVVAGVIQERATKTDVKKRPENLDEDDCDESGQYWHSEWEYTCNYAMTPIEPNRTPLVGDCIALDWGDTHPSDFGQNISWYSATVLAVNGNQYQVSYNDKWYEFKEFGTPKPSDKGAYNIYPALPPIDNA